MQAGSLIYEGKAKQVYATSDPDIVRMTYKDDATAFDGAKKGTINNKGRINNRIACMLFEMLGKKGIPTHLVEKPDDRNVLVRKLEMLPVEVVVRNVVAGSLAKRLGKEEGMELPSPILELYYKNDDLHADAQLLRRRRRRRLGQRFPGHGPLQPAHRYPDGNHPRGDGDG